MGEDLYGVNIFGPVIPYNSNDVYATHKARFGQGGFRTTLDLNTRNSISLDRREDLMIIAVQDNSFNNSTSGVGFYILDTNNTNSTSGLLSDNNNWFPIDMGYGNDGWVFPPPPKSLYTGTKGQRSFDDTHLYICVENGEWKRTAIDWFVEGVSGSHGTSGLDIGDVGIWDGTDWTYDRVVKNVDAITSSSGNLQITFTDNQTQIIEVGGDRWILPAPLSSVWVGTEGDRSYDDKYFYVCVQDGLWKRSAFDLFTFGIASTNGNSGNFFSLPDGFIPIWDTTTNKWVFNKVVSTTTYDDINNILNITYTDDFSTSFNINSIDYLNDLNDVTLTNSTNGEVLTYNGNQWINQLFPGITWKFPVPSSSNSVGTKGDLSYDDNFVYVCIETNTWKRINIDFFSYSGSTSGSISIPLGTVPIWDGNEYVNGLVVKNVSGGVQLGNFGAVITYTNDTTSFVNFTASTSGSSGFTLGSLADVNINVNSASGIGEYLMWDGVKWINNTIPNGVSASNGLTIISDVVKLGGDLTENTTLNSGNNILNLNSGISGNILINNIKYPKNDGVTNQVLTTDGSGNLSFTTISAGNIVNKYTSLTTFVLTSDVSSIPTPFTDLFSNNINDIGSTVFNANELQIGDKISLKLKGYLVCTQTGIIVFKTMLGAIDLAFSSNVVISAPKTDIYFEMFCEYTVRAIGVSGSIIGQGYIEYLANGSATSSTKSQIVMLSPSVINTTISNQVYGMMSMDNNFKGSVNITNSEIIKNKF